MRPLKFYGRSVEEALARVRRQLGPDPLIIETRSIDPTSGIGLLQGGARIEVTAAVETPAAALPPRSFGHFVKQQISAGKAEDLLRLIGGQPAGGAAMESNREQQSESRPALEESVLLRPVLEDLAELKSQLRQLLSASAEPDIREQVDLQDYRFLVAQGVDSDLLRSSFRRWLRWRTAGAEVSESAARFAAPPQSFREWLWAEWVERLNAQRANENSAANAASDHPVVTLMVGAHGVGKSTTLAKLASNKRQNQDKKVAILSLDRQRIGANEQWKRYAPLMDIHFAEAVTPEDTDAFMRGASGFDWIGIDTPGGMSADSPAGRACGALLAECPRIETLQALDGAARDQVNLSQMKQFQQFHPTRLVFSKLDLTPQPGALVNLTLNAAAPGAPAWLGTGSRIPEDLHEATPERLWSLVFEGAGEAGQPAGPATLRAEVA